MIPLAWEWDALCMKFNASPPPLIDDFDVFVFSKGGWELRRTCHILSCYRLAECLMYVPRPRTP